LFGFISLRAENKAIFISRAIVALVIGALAALLLFPQFAKVYVGEVESIWKEGYTQGTGNHRIWIWTRALMVFADNPILGVGPGCYGHVANNYATQEDAKKYGRSTQMYGQHIHNIYFELLSENGTVGVIAFFALVYVFRKRNLRIRNGSRRIVKTLSGNGVSAEARRLAFYAIALEGAVFAFLINSFFFNLLYYTWFWDLLIINILLYQRIRVIEAEATRK
jgi:O-antigen ligase